MGISLDDLKESNEFLNILLNNIVSAIFIVDKNVNIQNVNNSFKVLFQKKEDKILGELCGNAIGCVYAISENSDCGTTTNCATCTLRNSILSTFLQKVPTDKELLVRDFFIEGKIILKYFQYSTRYIWYNGEEMVLIIVDDITELEKQKLKLEKQNQYLKQLNDEKNKILGIAAHDIRSPLAIISSYASFLNDDNLTLDDDVRKKFLKIIQNRSLFGMDLLDDILDFSKIEAGEITINKTKTDLIQFVIEIQNFNTVLAKKKNQTINFNSNCEKLEINIDKFKIEQVLNNLLSNAMKFCPENSVIIINLEKLEDRIHLSVIDNGPGIPDNEIDKLFKPFQTTSVQATNSEKSTGLGLAISRKIIEAHKGEIGVKNNVDNGATFYFTLPFN